MTDERREEPEQQQAQETPAAPPVVGEKTSEQLAPTPAEPGGVALESSSTDKLPGEPAVAPEAAATKEAPVQEGAPAPPPEQEKPTSATAASYDGLDSGLSWFGYERFEPPVPVGYEAPSEATPRPAREISAAEMEERRRRILGRFASRRQEAETQKAWYQKIPLGALSMVPILVVLLVVAILYPPWRGSVFPASKTPLDEALLAAQPLPNSDEALRKMGIQEAQPQCWRALPGGVILMTRQENAARLAFAVPKNLSRVEIGCEVCILEREPTNWGASITLDGSVGVTIRDHPKNPGKDYVAGRRPGNTLAGYQHEIKPRMWNEMKLIVNEEGTRYFFNGTELKTSAPRPTALAKIEFNTYNTRLLLRNWRVKPLE